MSYYSVRKKKLQEEATWRPQRGSQLAFHENITTFELLYGGAAGGGKSDSLLIECARFVSTPGYRGIIFRRTFPELEKSLVPRAYEMFTGHAKPTNKGTEWRFPNGSVIYLSHMQREEDKEKHKSAEYDFAGFDELTSFSESQYVYIFSRVRGKNPTIVRRVRAATNPTGIGHGWVKKRFIDIDKETMKKFEIGEYEFARGWKVGPKVYTSFNDLPDNFAIGEPVFADEKYFVYKDKKSGLTRAFIPALLWGNVRLIKADPGYIKRLRALPPSQQDALLYGKWDVFEGQFFSEWDPKVHVTEPITIPKEWHRFVGIDFGIGAPFCALWGATDPEGKVHIYRELYAKGMSPVEQAEQIKVLSGDERIDWFAADPSMFSRSGSGESVAQMYDRHGLSLIPSNNARQAGWALLHDLLMSKKLVIHKNCVNLIRTLPSLNHSRRNPDDLDTMQEDHAVDALRYLLLTLRGFKSQNRGASAEEHGVPSWWADVKKKAERRSFIAPYRP